MADYRPSARNEGEEDSAYTQRLQDEYLQYKASEANAQHNAVSDAAKNAYNTGNYSGLAYTPNIDDPATQGEIKGSMDASRYYGQQSEIGADSQDYTSRLKAALNGNSANADKYLVTQSRKTGLANAKAGLSGVDNMGLDEQNRRNTMFQADAQNQEYRDNALKAFGSNVGARISGTESLKASGAGRSLASKPTSTMSYDSGTMGCVALVSLGLMSKETHASEIPFINKQSFEYIGYAIVITPFIPLILKNGRFAKWFSFMAHKYVYNLTGKKKSILGSAIKYIGGGFCSLVGRVKCL